MDRFVNILVGVDTVSDGPEGSSSLSAATEAAVENALWLAGHGGAKLTFMHAIETSAYADLIRAELGDMEDAARQASEEFLASLVRRAEAGGVAASHVTVHGKAWLEIIRQVVTANHDLVITGTRQHSRTTSVLLGSTGMKLLRKCPCPVWITKPSAKREMSSILVANDLSAVSDLALELGVSMSRLQGAELSVLHVLEFGIGQKEWDTFSIRQRARDEATARLRERLARAGANDLPRSPEIEIVVDVADEAIVKQIAKKSVDLLVMGTVARGGMQGVLTGNTAERLLPRIACSVLAVKPADFVCPVDIETSKAGSAIGIATA